MSIIFLLIPLSVLLATGFLCAFIWAVRSGQYEDTYTPSIRLLLQDPALPRNSSKPRPAGRATKTTIAGCDGAGEPVSPPSASDRNQT